MVSKLFQEYWGNNPCCEVCKVRKKLVMGEPHHIIFKSQFRRPAGKSKKEYLEIRDQADNLISLCRDCHNKAHGKYQKDGVRKSYTKDFLYEVKNGKFKLNGKTS